MHTYRIVVHSNMAYLSSSDVSRYTDLVYLYAYINIIAFFL